MSADSTPPEVPRTITPTELDPVKNLNNFMLLFPASEDAVGVHGDYRRLIKKLGWEDRLIGKGYPPEGETLDLHSEKWLNQTYKQFHAAVDEAIAKTGISLEEIRALRDKRGQLGISEEAEKVTEELNRKLLPVYEELLRMGYEPDDLTI